MLEKLELGKTIERVVCSKNPEQSYALYLPSHYSPDHSWPVVFAFDPFARGKIPVELMKDAAERYGYIVLGSNNSRNGPWKMEFEAADAMMQDVQLRFAVDLNRMYFAGLSGGAREASQLAQLCKCSAGVLLSAAGFSQNPSSSKEAVFPVFSAVGNTDFNYAELIPLQDKLEQAGYPHWLRVFDGQHQWAPAEVMEEALAWFRIQAMRSMREPHDNGFISGQFKKNLDTAEEFSTKGDVLSAWREYKQIASTFDRLLDVSSAKAKAEELARTKAVQDALKRERNDFEEQGRRDEEIFSAIRATETPQSPGSGPQEFALEQVRDLRTQSEKEKKPERVVVLKRTLGGIFIGAIERGNSMLDKKEYRSAALYFSAAAEARPDAEWPLRQLAVAQALDKNRKAVLETLRRIKPIDRGAFLAWLKSEPALEEMRAKGELKAFDK